MLRRIIFLIVLIASILLTYHGIKLDDPAEVMNNGNLLCLSCMGIE